VTPRLDRSEWRESNRERYKLFDNV